MRQIESSKEGGRSIKAERQALAPLFERLPHGPHKMSREQVINDQWLRMTEGMVAAVTRYGYYATSVRQVIALAGVSRRAFYEQFTNKEDCFAQTCQMICDRLIDGVVEAASASGADTENRVRKILAFLVSETEVDTDSMRLLLAEAPHAGPSGLAQLHNMMRVFERIIASEVASSGETADHPTPLVRGVIGGLVRSMLVLVRDGSWRREGALVLDLCRWVMLLDRPAARRLSEIAIANQRRGAPTSVARAAEQIDKARLQSAVLELLHSCEYADALTPIRIADTAGISVDRYFELYKDGHDCLVAAYDAIRRDLLTIAAGPRLDGDGWAASVVHMAHGLMHHLTENPLHARALTGLMIEPESELVDLSARLSHEFVALMIVDAPGELDPVIASELIKGAIWHLVNTFVERRKALILPLVADHLAYLVLALYVGGDEAMRVIEEHSSTSPV